MKYIQIFIIISGLILLMSFSEGGTINSNVISFERGWKFKIGDDCVWAEKDFDDSKWDSIQIGLWEDQGYQKYNGFAWYRMKVFIPSSLKESSYLKDSLQLFLGEIDDGDQLYLNGKFIGQNSKLYDTPPADSLFVKEAGYCNKNRRYIISTHDPCILWNKINTIAVRVIDWGGGGGIFAGKQYLSMVDLGDKLFFDKFSDSYKFENGMVLKTFTFKNNSNEELKGRFFIETTVDESKESLLKLEKDITIKPEESFEFPVLFKAKPETSTIRFSFKLKNSDVVVNYEDEVPYILTPKPDDSPQINGPKVTGAKLGSPFLFTIPVTGIRPIAYHAEGLPEGLVLDNKTGIISGTSIHKGEYKVIIEAKNNAGVNRRELKIIIGDNIVLTPPLGWNSWNSWGLDIDADKAIQSAHAFIEKGLINHGWSYINIDDGWEAKRDDLGEILPNYKFKNMKALGDSLHKMGLKFGIYSSPGTITCGGYTGSFQHENQDAKTYANWGVDYLKYDWCSYGSIAKDKSLAELKKPYLVMQNALREVKRDIVFSLCQYGMGDVWEWGTEVGGNLWRTTVDITDSWESLSEIGFSQLRNARFAGPGHWNDPDMMIVGWLGLGRNLHPSRLKVNEQYTHVSLWSLLSAPLLIGCDLRRLDDFTLNLLTNDEVLAINQDSLGKQAIPILKKGDIQFWVKDLDDGSKAVGIFNLGNNSQQASLYFSDIGLEGRQAIRDVWSQKNLSDSDIKFSNLVPSHGVILLKIKKIEPN